MNNNLQHLQVKCDKVLIIIVKQGAKVLIISTATH